MAVESALGYAIPEHPVLAKLLQAGGSELRAYRGYIGPSEKDGYLTLYPNLSNLGKSFEIRGADIVHVEDVPETFAPFAASMIWVKPDADVASRTVEVATRKASAKDTDMVEVRRGRIRMLRQSRSKARSMAQALPGENCASYCEDCTSQCEVCMSGCTCY